MKKDFERKKEEKIEVKKRKKIFIYGVIGIVCLFLVYFLTTYILTVTAVINEGSFRINDFVITSMVKVEELKESVQETTNEVETQEIENDIQNNMEVKLNVSQINKISVLIPKAESVIISEVYIDNIKIKGIDRNIYTSNKENNEIILNENKRLDLSYIERDNQYLIELELLNKNIIENASIPEGVNTIVYDGTLLKTFNYNKADLKYTLSGELNVVDSVGKVSICKIELEMPAGDIVENGIVLQREDITKYNLRLKNTLGISF